MAALVAAIVLGCAPDSSTTGSVLHGASRSGTKSTSGQGANPTPTPACGGTASAQGQFQGCLESGGQGVPTVRFLVVEPASLSIDVPAANGTTPAGYAATGSLAATVVLSNGQSDAKGVTWSVSDPTRLTIDASGAVQAKPGASAGSALVTATSVTDPSRTAQAEVQVSDDGQLHLEINPQDFGKPVRTTAVVSQNGTSILDQPVSSSAILRLPVGRYTVEVSRASTSLTVPPSTTSIANVQITPDGITTAAATLSF
ncbi:MAG: hypothetical protein KGR26_04615 [Cyanobacteria bacterium REEB65]|nr:hypothetical protein [Cyanobacteria bacterium REEB65]